MITLRPGRPEDAAECARICFEAFHTISTQHNFPPDLPSREFAGHLIGTVLNHPAVFSVVAERDGRVAGSAFMDLRSPIGGIGPVTVDVAEQNGGVGKALMGALLEHAREKGLPGTRLVQAAFHNRSLCLYTKLGFEVREPLAVVQGTPPQEEVPGYRVRAAAPADLPACDALCYRVHGVARAGELREAVRQGAAQLVEQGGRVTGYTTGVGFIGHTVGESNAELRALIAAAPSYFGPGFLLPTRNGELFRWCLERGLRVVEPLTLMSHGLYNEPRGAFLPSIVY